MNCPECDALHVFDVDQDYKGDYSKGMHGYIFFTPDVPGENFQCECGFILTGLQYYTMYNKEFTLLRREAIAKREKARKCDECSKLEGFDRLSRPWREVELIQIDSSLLCQECNANRIKNLLTDPSNSTEKYVFDPKTLKFKLAKVKRPCISCNKERWLNAENQWKNRCTKCYEKALNN